MAALYKLLGVMYNVCVKCQEVPGAPPQRERRQNENKICRDGDRRL